eukprot:c22311_g1_i1 orf=329-1126(+)
MSIPEGARFCIREVFDQDVLKEFAYINRIKDYYPNISVDTEFPGVINSSLQQKAISLEEHNYQILKANVDKMKLIQVGLTLTNEHGGLPMIDGAYCAWQFNLRDFDITADLYNKPSVDLLKRCGIDFDRNRREGIDSRKFGSLFVRCNLVCNRRVRYICFQGDYDFAYLLKLITGELLPNTKAEFKQKELAYFGAVYDLRVMQVQHLKLYGGLDKLAKHLGIKRIGAAHQAGSDSLLTSSTFQKIKESYLDKCKGSSDVMIGLVK